MGALMLAIIFLLVILFEKLITGGQDGEK